MKISIIIPVYNGEKYLDETIQSVLRQEFDDFELVIVNDGSKDATSEIIDRYCEKDQRIRKISIQNSGVSVARNIGFNVCDGDFVWFVDADDLIPPEFLFQIFKVEKSQFDVLQFQYQKFEGDEEIFYGNRSKSDLAKYNCVEDFFLNDTYTRSLWRNIIRTDVIRRNKLEFKAGLRFGEDLLFTLSVLLSSENVYKTSTIGYFYRKHSGSVMARPRTLQDALDHLVILEELLVLYHKCQNSVSRTILRDEIKSISTTYIAFCAESKNRISLRTLQRSFNEFYDSKIRDGHSVLKSIPRLRFFRFSIIPVYLYFKTKRLL